MDSGRTWEGAFPYLYLQIHVEYMVWSPVGAVDQLHEHVLCPLVRRHQDGLRLWKEVEMLLGYTTLSAVIQCDLINTWPMSNYLEREFSSDFLMPDIFTQHNRNG